MYQIIQMKIKHGLSREYDSSIYAYTIGLHRILYDSEHNTVYITMQDNRHWALHEKLTLTMYPTTLPYKSISCRRLQTCHFWWLRLGAANIYWGKERGLGGAVGGTSWLVLPPVYWFLPPPASLCTCGFTEGVYLWWPLSTNYSLLPSFSPKSFSFSPKYFLSSPYFFLSLPELDPRESTVP